MKFRSKVQYPLIFFLIVLVFTALRIALPAIPYDWYFLLTFRFLIIAFSQEFFHSDWALWDLLLLICAIFAILMAPAPENHGKLRRYLLRPLLVIAVFAITTPLVTATAEAARNAYDEYQNRLRQQKLEATYEEIRAFLDEADVGYAYNTNTQRFDPTFLEAFPELASTHLYIEDNVTKTAQHVTDVILLDYDTHSVGIVYFRYGDPEFYLYQLHPVDHIASQLRQSSTQLSAPGESFVCYSYSFDLGQYTDGFSLTMADGSIYAIRELSQKDDLLFLGLNSSTELLNYWSNQND